MAKTSAPFHPVHSQVEAWERYAEGEAEAWRALVAEHGASDDAELRSLAALAAAELEQQGQNSGMEANRLNHALAADEGAFALLLQAARARRLVDPAESARRLGEWLLTKTFYADFLLVRFCEAGLEAENYALVEQVCRKFLSKKQSQAVAGRALFLALYGAGRYKDAAALFEKLRKLLDRSEDPEVVQRAGVALIQLGRYEEAERTLLPVARKLGADADLRARFDELKQEYAAPEAIQRLSKKNQRDWHESMQLGMAYLFSARYNEALQIFEELRSIGRPSSQVA